MTIVENLQREDLNPMEQARAYERLSREFKLTQEQMAVRTGKDRSSVGNFIRLLKLPEEIQNLVELGDLTFGHARALLALGTVAQMAEVSNWITAKSMSVRQTESYIQGLINPEQKPKKQLAAAAPQDPNVREAQDRLQRRLGLKVHIQDRKGKGRVIIEYTGVDDFDAILGALGE
jgi:ParB family chromosome partitioning protein